MSAGGDYVLWGSAGHARVLASLIAARDGRVVALFDNDARTRSALDGVPLFHGIDGFRRWHAGLAGNREIRALAAIGGARGRDRLEIQEIFVQHGLRVDALIHPDASVCPTAVIGAGTQVLAQSVIAAGARLGRGCIVNHRAGIDHECALGDGVHVGPGATLCGCVRLADNVFIGAGATVLPRVRVGANTTIGAGAVVTQDVAEGVVVAGVPARILRPS